MQNSPLTKVAAFFRVIRIGNSCAVFVATLIGGVLSIGGQIVSGTTQLLSDTARSFSKSGGHLSASEGLPPFSVEFYSIALASASMAFLAAFGYALNDYYDARADAINRPDRPIPSGTLSRESVLAMAVFCVLVAALFAAALRPVLQLTLAGMCVLVWLYSARIKRTGLMGNVLVSLLAGSTLLVGGLSAGYVRPTLFPGLLAVLVNLPREIIKGVQDLKGDSLVGGRGVVRKRGKRFALRFSSVLVLILVVVSFLPYAAGVYNRYYLAIVLLLDALLVWTAVLMWGSASLDSLVPEIRAEPERRVVSEASAHLERGLGAEGKRAPARGLEPEGSTEIEHRLETAIRTLKLTMLVGLLAIGLGSF